MASQLSQQDIFTISQLNRRVRQLLETHLTLIWVRGEISNLAKPGSGHWYFTLKDSGAQIRCAMFRNRNNRVNPAPKEGDQVLVRGRVSLYENRGDYQLIAEHMEPDGTGLLQQQFEALKKTLDTQGLFDTAYKTPLPEYPQHIGVITSPTGAAISDIIHVLARRSPWIPITLYPTLVQGKDAAADICAAIQLANEHNRCDVLIIGRGGGSLEDLWPFNEETVARAIFDSTIPIVSAVGHETDFTIADFVADQRAPTPSAAAETSSPDGQALSELFQHYQSILSRLSQQHFDQQQQQLNSLLKRLRNPADKLREQTQHLDHLDIRLSNAITAVFESKRGKYRQLQGLFSRFHPQQPLHQLNTQLHTLSDRMNLAIGHNIKNRQEKLTGLAATMNAVSPLATLERGYAIAMDANEQILHSIDSTQAGDKINVIISDGQLACTVNNTRKKRIQ